MLAALGRERGCEAAFPCREYLGNGEVFLGGVPGKWLVPPLGAAGSGDRVGQRGRALLGQQTSR